MGILSLWRFPLDQVALSEVTALADRQPRCSITQDTDFSALTIYNYQEYVDVPFATLESALTQMFSDMTPTVLTQGIGGSAFIQQREYSGIHAISFTVPDQCNVIATGGGGPATGSAASFHHFSIDFTFGPVFLSCNATGSYTAGGKYFRSLSFNSAALATAGDTCIYAATENCRAYNCTFTDIPTAFSMQGPSCALEQCTVKYVTGNGAGPLSRTVVDYTSSGLTPPFVFDG